MPPRQSAAASTAPFIPTQSELRNSVAKAALNRKVYDSDVGNVTVPESAGDVKRMLGETMADIRAGRMDPKLGSTLGYLGTALLRAFEVAELEQRLERLEQRDEPEK